MGVLGDVLAVNITLQEHMILFPLCMLAIYSCSIKLLISI